LIEPGQFRPDNLKGWLIMKKYFVRFLNAEWEQIEIECKADSQAEAMDYVIFYYDVDKFLFVCEL
jgi:hypothetical protein